jgi:EAL domain-containing protein (putative c-di-GMP-specific phosphodiesterase class I)
MTAGEKAADSEHPDAADLPLLLVIDDDRFFQAQVTALLQERYRIHQRFNAVDDLSEVLAMADTVMLDLNMPGVDGVSFITELAALEHPPKLLIVSGCDSTVLELARQTALLQGLRRTGVLRKPLTRQKLLEATRSLDELSADPTFIGAPVGVVFTESDVIDAARAGELAILYQPQICLDTREVTGVEALVRWDHPSLGRLSPAMFIEAIEASEHAEEFTLAIAKQALLDMVRLAEAGVFHGKISVNVPPKVLESASFTDHLMALITAAQFPPERFQCEVTERGIENPSPAVSATLARLRMRGIQLAIDDFGIGQSGLSKLKSQAFDELKIDQSFIKDLANSAGSRSIVESVVHLANLVGIRVIAEGIENRGTLEVSASIGVPHAQGYHFARPMNVADLDAWLFSWQAKQLLDGPGGVT